MARMPMYPFPAGALQSFQEVRDAIEKNLPFYSVHAGTQFILLHKNCNRGCEAYLIKNELGQWLFYSEKSTPISMLDRNINLRNTYNNSFLFTNYFYAHAYKHWLLQKAKLAA